MADNRTMAELLQAPTEGYEDAIVVPEIEAANFEIKHGLLTLLSRQILQLRRAIYNGALAILVRTRGLSRFEITVAKIGEIQTSLLENLLESLVQSARLQVASPPTCLRFPFSSNGSLVCIPPSQCTVQQGAHSILNLVSLETVADVKYCLQLLKPPGQPDNSFGSFEVEWLTLHEIMKSEEYYSDILYTVSIKEDTVYLCLHFTRNHKESKSNMPYVFRVPPYPFDYPKRRLTMEEVLAKYIDEDKSRLKEAYTETMNERCSAVLVNKLPLKEKDPRSFTIPCQVLEKHKEAEDLAADHLSKVLESVSIRVSKVLDTAYWSFLEHGYAVSSLMDTAYWLSE
ncbi:hypothetical protein Tco_0614455 [Tanacetum coccineum]